MSRMKKFGDRRTRPNFSSAFMEAGLRMRRLQREDDVRILVTRESRTQWALSVVRRSHCAEVLAAHNRHRAIADAKAGHAIEPTECEKRVGANIDAAKRIGGRGVPTLMTETGDLMGNHFPPSNWCECSSAGSEPSRDIATPNFVVA